MLKGVHCQQYYFTCSPQIVAATDCGAAACAKYAHKNVDATALIDQIREGAAHLGTCAEKITTM